MKYPERLHPSTKSNHVHSREAEPELSLHVKEAQYHIGGVHTFCWLVRTNQHHAEHAVGFSVLMYSAPCGLIEIKSPDRETAEEIFSLFARYEVSPYHAEDIIEDREINATIRFL